MTPLEKLHDWKGYSWAKENNVQSVSEAWIKLQRSDWMVELATAMNVKLDESKLRLFACDYAEKVLPLFEKLRPKDRRPHQAIKTALRFVRGEATEKELAAAKAGAVAGAGAIIVIARTGAIIGFIVGAVFGISNWAGTLLWSFIGAIIGSIIWAAAGTKAQKIDRAIIGGVVGAITGGDWSIFGTAAGAIIGCFSGAIVGTVTSFAVKGALIGIATGMIADGALAGEATGIIAIPFTGPASTMAAMAAHAAADAADPLASTGTMTVPISEPTALRDASRAWQADRLRHYFPNPFDYPGVAPQ